MSKTQLLQGAATLNAPPPAPATPKPHKGLNADYTPAEWFGVDTSGLMCVGVAVLVKVDEAATNTAGGVRLTEDMQERLSMASETGLIIAMGSSAFRLHDDGSKWGGVKPEPGDRVVIEKFAGTLLRGLDGDRYRLMPYGSVLAVFESHDKYRSRIANKIAELRQYAAMPGCPETEVEALQSKALLMTTKFGIKASDFPATEGKAA
jgi:co-chaperonin GroES (HSP10)